MSIAQLELFDEQHALGEAQRYHTHSGRLHDFPYIAWNWRGADSERMQQKCFPAARLPWLIGQIGTRPGWRHEHHFIVQNEFKAPNRRALNLWSLGLLWADIDLRSPSHEPSVADGYTHMALLSCADLGIPEPSIIVWSGRGLHLKWTLDKPLPAQALPRWSAAMRSLHEKLQSGCWPVDDQARDVSRVLRIAGTMNPKPGDDGQIILRLVYVTHTGPSYDFDYLCEWLLPYTRQEVEQFRQDDQARHEADKAARKQWRKWERNRQKAGASARAVLDAAVLAAGEAAQGLHWRRLEVIRRAAEGRGGIQPGQRNEWLWIAANSLGWGLGDAGKLWHELPQLVREIAPSLTIGEARSSASSVYQRLKQGGRDALYRLKTQTLIDRLGLTDAEAAGLRGAGHGTKNPGAMGLPKLRDLTFEQWQAKVAERMRAGGAYTASIVSNEVRKKAGEASGKARASVNEDRRASARLMRSSGMSAQAIADSLDVSLRTVWNWLV